MRKYNPGANLIRTIEQLYDEAINATQRPVIFVITDFSSYRSSNEANSSALKNIAPLNVSRFYRDPVGPLRISPALARCCSIRTAVDRNASYRSSNEARPLRSTAVRGGLRSRLTADALKLI